MISRILQCSLALALVGAGATKVYCAEGQPGAPAPELSAQIGLEMPKFGPLQDKGLQGGDWSGALKFINDLIPKAQGPYDSFFLNNIKWQILAQDEKNPNAPPEALAALLEALKLTDQYKFAEPRELEALLQNGSMLYISTSEKKSTAERLAGYRQAAALMKRYIDVARSKSVDNISYYSQLVMQMYGDPEYPKGPEHDALLEEGLKYAKMGTQMWPTQPGASLTPSDNLFVVLLSGYLSQEKFDEATSVIEYLVSRDPKQERYWSQLAQVYVTLAYQEDQKGAAKDKNRVFAYNMRALDAYDRAQANGFLKTPKDNEMIVGIYGTLGQYGFAAERMEKELKSGGIESREDKWENAALYYQLDGKHERAVALLKEASAKFPSSGRLDFLAAQAYAGYGDSKNAYEMAVSAAKKGMADKTWRAWAYAAYQANMMDHHEDALKAVEDALKDPNAAKEDKALPDLKNYLEDQIATKAKNAADAARLLNGK